MDSPPSAVCAVVAALFGWLGAGPGCDLPRIGADGCAQDRDCPSSTVCREAQCRVACPGGHFVGEKTEVAGGTGSRPALVSSCDRQAIWVRYETGIEEKVEPARFRREPRAQRR